MSKKEYQYNHFVPQFYLRKFSNNKKNIGMYRLNTKEFIPNAAIKSVGGRDFLYGKDGFLEKWFSKLETIWSKILGNIIENEEISNNSEDYTYLLMFIYLSDIRTAQVADYQNALLQEYSEFIIKNDKRFENSNLDPKKIEYTIPNLVNIEIMPNIINNSMKDLYLFILKNNSEIDFITSDCPVVKYNLLFNERNYIRNYGYQQMGFQCFIPISNKLCLCLMDPIPYNIKCTDTSIINLNNSNLVFELNKLFVENSDEVIFFSERYDENSIKRLIKSKPIVKKQKVHKFGTDKNCVIAYESKSVHIDIKMPYFKVRKEFKRAPFPLHSDGPLRPSTEK